MINFNTVSTKIFKILKGHGYKLKLYTDEGMETVDPEEARWFYVKEPNMMVLLDEPNQEVKVNKNSTIPLSAYESTLQQIKKVATHYILNFTIRNFDKEVVPKGFSPEAKKRKKQKQQMDSLAESSFSKMAGSKKTSTQALEGVKVVVKHKAPVDENIRGSRSRNIKQIFIENNGERTAFPYKSLNGARAMARHIQCGGAMDDQVGQHILKITENVIKLSEFYSSIKQQRLINESNNDVVILVKENIHVFNEELRALSGSKTYFTAKSMVKEQELQEEGDMSALRDMFTAKQFNEQFEGVMNLLNNMVNTNNKLMLRLQEAASKPILCKSAPLAEESVVEYTSKGAKFGNKLLNLGSVIVDNSELVEFVVKVGKKLISEQNLTDFETGIVKNVLENVYVEKKLPKETKDLVESYISRLELSLSKHEYPQLMHLRESKAKATIKVDMDTNGNKILIVGSPDRGAMSIQTNQNLPYIHKNGPDGSEEAMNEIDAYVSEYGSARQKAVWSNYKHGLVMSEGTLNRYSSMTQGEWQAEYNRLVQMYNDAEANGEHDRAERIGDRLSDMEMHNPRDAHDNGSEFLGESDGDVVVKNDGDIIGSFLREFDYDSWGIPFEDMRDLNMFHKESMGDRVNVSEREVNAMFMDIMERAEKDGMHLVFNDDGDIVETSDQLTEDEELEDINTLQQSFKQIADLIKKVYGRYNELKNSAPTSESIVTEWNYKGSNIALPEHMLDGIKREIDVLVMQYKAAIEGIRVANKLKGTPNGDRHIKRVMANRNRIWSRLNKLDRMLNNIER